MNHNSYGMCRFNGKVALVTGGASGIGRATAARLAAEGAEVIIADKNVELGQQTASSIEGNGGKVSFIAVDLTNDESVRSAAQMVADQYPALHLLVNNAAIVRQGRIEDGSWLQNWDPETRSGLRGWVLITQELFDETRGWCYCKLIFGRRFYGAT